MNLSFIMANNTCRSILTSVCLNYINTTEEKQAQVYTHRESEHHRESIYMFNVCLQKGIMSDQRRYGNKLWEGGESLPSRTRYCEAKQGEEEANTIQYTSRLQRKYESTIPIS